jgi:hypothetical protein
LNRVAAAIEAVVTMVRARVAVAAPHAAVIVMLSAFMANLSE